MAAKASAATLAAAAPLPAEPEPKMQQDIHFVLRIEATLKLQQPSAAAETRDLTSHTTAAAPAASTPAGADPGADRAQEAPAVNPATLALQLKFTPWVGPEVGLEPAELAALGQPSPSRASTPATTAGRVTPIPAAGAAGKGGKGAPAVPEPATTQPEEPRLIDTTPKWWCSERHFKATVDDAFVRAMAEAEGMLNLPVTLTQPPAEPPSKAVKGQPPPPETVVISYTSFMPLACAKLLVGDTEVKSVWPSKLQPMPAELGTVCSNITITLKALSIPEPTPEEAAAAAAAAKSKPAAKSAAPPAKGGKGGKDAPAAPDLSGVPGQPIAILTPALASRLNPLVIMPLRANAMPDAPATPKLLDTRCEPVKLRVRWPPGASTISEQVGRPGVWQTLQAKDSRGPGLACRAVGFGQPQVMLAGDLQLDQLLLWCKESPLTIEVHDRTVIPEPPEFPIKAQEGVAAQQQEDEGYVCGIARVPLLDLVRGRTQVRFTAPLAPHTTIRGAASLDWGRRPGNYAASSAVIKGWVRCAVPLTAMVGVSLAERVYSRAIFTMDYRDSELFHLLEDTIRQQNAWALGLAAPEPKPQDVHPSATDRPLRTSSQHNSRNSTPSRTHNSDSEGGGKEPPRGGANTSHSTHSVGPGERQHSRSNSRSPAPVLVRNNSSRQGHSARRVSDAAITPQSPNTPQALLYGMERNSSMGTGVNGQTAGAPRAVLWSTPHSTTGKQDRKELRFHNFGSAHESESSDQSDDNEPQSPVELALQAALSELETIKMDNRLIQTLSTTKLTPEQTNDHGLELLTGWHVVDGKERTIAVEGKQAGAMKAIQAIIAWALEDARPEEGWQRRGVLYNSGVLYPGRLWSELGVDLHIVKLHAPLPKIIADASSYATGKVRVDCIAGLRRLAAVRQATWARLVDDLALYPTPHMLHLVDKKFGGELTKADVFGVEVQEFDTDEEDGGGMGLIKEEDVRSSHSSSKRSAKSARSRNARTIKSKRSSKNRSRQRYTRKRPALQPLDRHNEAYIHLREEARARRLAANWHAHNLEHITSLASTAATIRADWAHWNPQREAARKLEEAVKKGTIRLEDTYHPNPRAQIDRLFAGQVTARDARLHGWAPHNSAFKWPAPKDPGSYAVHPHAPSMFRKEQLAEPWEETTADNAFLQMTSLTGPNFITTVKNETGLFGQDPEFWKTVHMGGMGRELEETERKATEKAEWSRKLVGGQILHITLPVRNKTVCMTDRTKHILLDDPKKKGFSIAHVPPAPYSMHLAEPWTSPSKSSMRMKPPPETFVLPNLDFKRCLAVPKSSVSKPGHGHLQSWTASIHDQCYHDE